MRRKFYRICSFAIHGKIVLFCILLDPHLINQSPFFQIKNEIFEDQDFTSTHERGNAENESDATKKKKKKKKKKKSKNVELDEDPYDKTEPV